MRTLRTNRETTPEGFHGQVLSDHITRNREASQQVNDPQSLPAHEVARLRSDMRELSPGQHRTDIDAERPISGQRADSTVPPELQG